MDGNLLCSSSFPVSSQTNQNFPVLIGRSHCANGSPCNSFTGQVDELGLWNRALTPAEITSLYQAEPPTLGCTAPSACNYDAEANVDDGSCYSCDVPASHCGPGTHWDATLSACVADVPSAEAAENCTLMSLQELTEGYLTLLDIVSYQDSLLAAQQGGNQDNGDGTSDNWTCGAPLPYQGYDYATVQIGNQCWFAENLRSTQYANGEGIPDELSDAQWSGATSGATSVYGEGSSSCTHQSPSFDACNESLSLQEFGRLYNGFAISDNRGLCPNEWHIPTDGEWTELEEYVASQGSAGSEGTALRSTQGWTNNGNGSDDFGFSAGPSGLRAGNGHFTDSGYNGAWWSSTSLSNGNLWARNLRTNVSEVFRPTANPLDGYSVRCLKD